MKDITWHIIDGNLLNIKYMAHVLACLSRTRWMPSITGIACCTVKLKLISINL